MDWQCEGCKTIKGDFDESFQVCAECEDKAADYDSCKQERDKLLSIINNALAYLADIDYGTNASNKVGRAIGTLQFGLTYCKHNKVQEKP